MKTSDFYYDLPEELIAQDPLTDRSSSRLMILDKETGDIQHKIFKDIIDELNPEDCLVINDTKGHTGQTPRCQRGYGCPYRSSSLKTKK